MVSMNTLVKEKFWKKITEKMARAHLEKEPIFGRILNLRPFFGLFYIMKSDESKNMSRFGRYKYIGEEIRLKKIYKKMARGHKIPSRQNFSDF